MDFKRLYLVQDAFIWEETGSGRHGMVQRSPKAPVVICRFQDLRPITPKVVAQIRAVGAGGCSSANTFATIRSVTLTHELQIGMKDQIISYRQMCNAESVTLQVKDDPRVCKLNCYGTPLFRSAAVSCFMPCARFSRPTGNLKSFN